MLLEFPSPKFPYGRGIIVEAQVKHKDKDFASVFREYEAHGYSTYVAYLSDIQGSELQFKNHRLHKLWPNGVPPDDHWWDPPDYIEGVADSVDLQDVTRVWVPPEYIEFRLPELISPRWFDGVDWEFVDTLEFHSYGEKQAWWDLWVHPSNTVRLELWEENTDTGDKRFQTVAVISHDIKPLYRFFIEIGEEREDDLYHSAPYWETVNEVELTAAQGIDGWLSLSKPPHSDPMWILGRSDPRGNSSTIGIEYRNGDEERMRSLGSMIEDAITD